MRLFIHQLHNGRQETIDMEVPNDFLDIDEKELLCTKPVRVRGSAYITDNTLILNLNCSTTISMPCSICNNMISIPLDIKNIYHSMPLEDLSSEIVDFSVIVRDELLLAIPQFIECANGSCPERSLLAHYTPKKNLETPTHHFPFAGL